jgi:hypothetical protein
MTAAVILSFAPIFLAADMGCAPALASGPK